MGSVERNTRSIGELDCYKQGSFVEGFYRTYPPLMPVGFIHKIRRLLVDILIVLPFKFVASCT